MAKVTYNLSKKQREDGKSRVIVALQWNREIRMNIKTDIFVFPFTFQDGSIIIPKRGKLNGADIDYTQRAQTDLQTFTAKLFRVCEVTPDKHLTKDWITQTVEAFCDIRLEDITYQSIKEATRMNGAIKGRTLYEYVELFLQDKNTPANEATAIRALFRALHRWEEYKRISDKSFILSFDTLNNETLQEFKFYFWNEYQLKTEHPNVFARLLELYPAGKYGIKERGENTVINNFNKLKCFCHWCINKGITQNNPFKGFEIGNRVFGVPFYLTKEERNQVASFDLSEFPALELQRDIFVFQCLVGCRMSDLYTFTPSNIHNGILEYVPIKTRNKSQEKPRVPLNGMALALIAKYEGYDAQGRLFPFCSQRTYEYSIKKFLKICGIVRNVPVRNSLNGETEMKPIYEVASSHMARRTFIGCLYKQVQDPNLIGKMSGHVEGSKAFARYRNIDDELLKETIELL